MNICVVGGGGYVGSTLVPNLLNSGHKVTVLDIFWYGDHLQNNVRLTKVRDDMRDVRILREVYKDQDAVIHLACISNDPSFDMNPNLGRDINYTCFKDTLDVLQECKVPRFIYASSSSVYGLSELSDVTEDSPKKPLTDYSKYKLMCEEDLKNSDYKGCWTIVRPATVCGYSERLRLDLVVNILTINALVNRKITLFGKDQKRPNIHVIDMARAYSYLLTEPRSRIDKKTFNVGFENKTLLEIAELVKKNIGQDVEIEIKETNDPRSYHINSDKISKLGFKTVVSIEDAILSIKDAYESCKIYDGLNNAEYYNIKKMKEIGLA